MSESFKSLTRISVLALAAALTAGCAAKGGEKSTAEQAATEARQMAERASSKADEASAAAARAQETADAAMSAAERGNACCTDVNEKLDRMFQRSMRK